jgi:hypothetical protein
MSQRSSADKACYRIGLIGAVLTGAGIILSGPVAMLLVSKVHAQPAWQSASVFVANYHWIQSLTFYFGMLLVVGSVQMLTAIFLLGRRDCGLLALIIGSIAAALIFFNYFVQVIYVPGLVLEYSSSYDPLITALTMSNPLALTWALEMGGYGLLGLATWLAAGFFRREGIEKAAYLVFILNGILSLAGTLWTSIEPGWVLSLPGLIAFAAWNSLYLALVILFYLVLRRRLLSSNSCLIE